MERENMIKEAEVKNEAIKQEKIMQAKEKFLQLKTEHEKSIGIKNNEIAKLEQRIKQRDGELTKRLEDATRKNNETDQYKDWLQSHFSWKPLSKSEFPR